MKLNTRNDSFFTVKMLQLLHAKNYWMIGLLLLIPFFLYIQTVSFEFTGSEDLLMAIGNLHDLSLAAVFKTETWKHTETLHYRPLELLSYVFDFRIGGGRVFMYHLINLLLHVCTVAALFYLLLQFGLQRITAFLSALFFALHPVLSTAVAFVGARADLLIGLFSLFSMIFLLKALGSRRTMFIYLHLFCFALSCLSKESAVMLLFAYSGIILLKGRWKNVKTIRSLLLIAGWLLIALLCLYQWYCVSSISLTTCLISLTDNIAVVPQLLLMFFMPLQLSTFPLLTQAWVVLGWIVFAAISLLLIISRKNKGNSSLIGWILFIIAILSSLLYKSEQPFYVAAYSEQQTYLAYVGLIILLADFCDRSILIQPSTGIVLLLVLCIWVPLSAIHATDYSNVQAYLTKGTDQQNSGAAVQKGMLYMQQRNADDALRCFNQSIEWSDGQYAPAFYNRGVISFQQKNYPAAITDFSTVLLLDSNNTDAFIKRGLSQIFINRYSDASKDLEKASEQDSLNSELHYAKGTLYIHLQQFEKASASFSKSLASDSFNTAAYNDKGFAEYRLAHYSTALYHYHKATETYPGFLSAYYNKGVLYYETGAYKQAVQSLDTCLSLANNFAYAWFYRGMAKYKISERNAACTDWKEAYKLGFKPVADTIRRYCGKDFLLTTKTN